nr:MAG TPA: tail assembly chaperone protein [Caudoviricetes sp.]
MKQLQKLKVGGREYPCRVTMGAMVRFKRATGKDVNQLNQSDISELVQFIYCCVQSACKADDVAFDVDFETFADQLEPDSLNSFYAQMGDAEKKTTLKARA